MAAGSCPANIRRQIRHGAAQHRSEEAERACRGAGDRAADPPVGARRGECAEVAHHLRTDQSNRHGEHPKGDDGADCRRIVADCRDEEIGVIDVGRELVDLLDLRFGT
jgi:hypothetical protein